ncbi:MAG: HEPN domain-containing protein [Candidatus Peregrinibacteria bacterium]|nr:HEPN domain-containing protein [Candidatus Peregrinibacteria bacterium]
MTTADVIKHWRKGAQDALDAAKLLEADAKYDLALFHCHLALEKALKAAVMERTKKPHPKIHRLLSLAKLLQEDWSIDDQELFDKLSDFAVAARYDDPAWAEQYATAENSQQWIRRTSQFLSTFLT